MALSKVGAEKNFLSKEEVYHLADLRPGDHIHTPHGRSEYGLRRHMIVVEVDLEGQGVNVIHYNNKKCIDPDKTLHQVIESWENLDFGKANIKRMVCDKNARHPPREIVRRAQLAVGMKEIELPSVPSRFRPSFYSASYHFAVLCVTGQGMAKIGESQKVYHNCSVVEDMNDVKPGDHICCGWYWGDYSRYRHMIVTDVDMTGSRVKVIHYNSHSRKNGGNKEPHSVIQTWEVFDLNTDKLWKYDDDPKTVLSPEITMLTANKCVGKGGNELTGILPPPLYRTVYSPSRYFAEWCKTGLGWDYVNDLQVDMGGDVYCMAPVNGIEDISDAEHVAYADDFGGLTHGIIEYIDREKNRVNVIYLNVKDDTKTLRVMPQLWDLIDTKLYYCRYGESMTTSHSLKRAKRHIGSDTKKLGKIIPDITNCPDLSLMSQYFVRWCKVGKGWAYFPVGKTKLSPIDQISPGDHLRFKRFQGLYAHHAIVESVQTDTKDKGSITIIHRTKTESNMYKIERKELPTTHKDLDFASDNVYKVNYHQNDCFEVDQVLEMARSLVETKGYNLLNKNCEHFARWCKTGENKSLQVTTAVGKFNKITVCFLEQISRTQSVLISNILNEAIEIGIIQLSPAVTQLAAMGIGLVGIVAVTAILIIKEYRDFRKFKFEQKQLLDAKLIDKTQYKFKCLRHKCRAISSVVCMVIGAVIGQVITIWAPIVGHIVSIILAGVGYALGYALGPLVANMVDKLSHFFEKDEYGNALEQKVPT